MQGLFSLSFDKKLYFYCFLNLCVKYVYYNLMHTKNHIIKTDFNPRSLEAWKVKLNIESLFSFSLKNRRFVRWKRRSVLFLFQIFTELIGFFKGFGVSRRFAGAVQTAYEQ